MTKEQIDPMAKEWLTKLYGEPALGRTAMIYDLDPDFAQTYLDYVVNSMYRREVLPHSVRELCAIAALTVVNAPDQLYVHIHAALRMGATREEVLEAILQMCVYGGFPPVLAALKTYRQAIADYGLPEPAGREPREATTSQPDYEQRVQERIDRAFPRGDSLFGKGFSDRNYQQMERWSPGFGRVGLGFIYGGMYDRSVLDPKTRELLVVAATVVKNALPQLDTHSKGALRMGATRDEVMEVILQMSVYGGMPYMLQAARRFEAMLEHWSPESERAGG